MDCEPELPPEEVALPLLPDEELPEDEPSDLEPWEPVELFVREPELEPDRRDPLELPELELPAPEGSFIELPDP